MTTRLLTITYKSQRVCKNYFCDLQQKKKKVSFGESFLIMTHTMWDLQSILHVYSIRL